MNLIETKNLSVTLGNHRALRDVNINISSKEIVTIVGPNGAGKSTFLRTIIGAIAYHQGTVYKKPGLRFGYVPQRLQIDSTLPLTVDRFLNLPTQVDKENLREALSYAQIDKLCNRQLSQLSGGELQRVLLARALLSHPEILLLDEATQGMDHPASVSFYQQIEKIRAKLGCAILMVSHDLHVVMAASHRVICLNGHVCCHGSPEDVASNLEYQKLFSPDTKGAMSIYRHVHNHRHDHIKPNEA